MKQIENYPNYCITNSGRVWSKPRKGKGWNSQGKWLAIRLNAYGYPMVFLSKNKKGKSYLTHRLVAQHFIPNPENKPQINHLNGIKTDNRVENLEWVTAQENSDHARKIGLYDNMDISGEKNGMAKLTWNKVNEIRSNYISKGVFTRKPWEKYDISIPHYYRILNGESWKEIK